LRPSSERANPSNVAFRPDDDALLIDEGAGGARVVAGSAFVEEISTASSSSKPNPKPLAS
jgi:hypothetical protein